MVHLQKKVLNPRFSSVFSLLKSSACKHNAQSLAALIDLCIDQVYEVEPTYRKKHS